MLSLNRATPTLVRPRATRFARGAVLSLLAAVVLTACGASEEELTGIGADLPSVTGVSVGMPVDGDKDLPVDAEARVVEVTMEPDVGTKQVLAVFDAYRDLIAGDDLGAVVVVLEAAHRPRLAASDGGAPSEAMVDALLSARDDPDSAQFTLFVDGDDARITHRLRDVGFTVVNEHAELHAGVKGIEDVLVSSGNRSLALSTDKKENNVARARAALVDVVDADFDLIEARVQGSGDLTLVVEPQSLPAATFYVNQTVELAHGKVSVQG